VSSIPYGSLNPSVSRFRGQTYRLAINSGQPDVGLRLVDLQARQGTRITEDSPFCEATRMDTPGRFRRMAVRWPLPRIEVEATKSGWPTGIDPRCGV
jgi:hypothetical protein